MLGMSDQHGGPGITFPIVTLKGLPVLKGFSSFENVCGLSVFNVIERIRLFG